MELTRTIKDALDPQGISNLLRHLTPQGLIASNGVRGVHVLLVLRRWHAVGEGDGEGVQSWLHRTAHRVPDRCP